MQSLTVVNHMVTYNLRGYVSLDTQKGHLRDKFTYGIEGNAKDISDKVLEQ